MRKLHLSLFMGMLLGLAFIACTKDSDENIVEEVENYTVEEELESETLSADVEKSLDDELAEYGIFFSGKEGLEELDKGPNGIDRNADCATRTASAERGTYPNTVTIQLSEGCTGRNGQSITGRIDVTLSAPPRQEGATKTVTLTDFEVDGVRVNGTKTMTAAGFATGTQQIEYTKTVDFTITKEDGTQVRRQSSLTHRFVAGDDTDTFEDDRWERTGTISGVNSRGQDYSISIRTPIVRAGGCRWPVSGTKDLTRGDRTVTIDYGEGECDRMITASMGDVSREIEIGRD